MGFPTRHHGVSGTASCAGTLLMVEPPEVGCVHRGDCLHVLRAWPDRCVDLCYADPPPPAGARRTLFGTRGSDRSSPTDDVWRWDEHAAERVEAIQRNLEDPAHDAVIGLHITLGECGIMAFLAYMAARLVEIKRVLKPTGSVYVHCGLAAGHYLKVLMDAVFGPQNFLNEIIWCDDRPYRPNLRQFATAHEAVLWYASGSRWTFHGRAESHSENRPTRSLSWAFMPTLRSRAGNGTRASASKPLELLEHIIEVGSNPGDLVLDPFCRDLNIRDVALGLGRGWVGIATLAPVGLGSQDP